MLKKNFLLILLTLPCFVIVNTIFANGEKIIASKTPLAGLYLRIEGGASIAGVTHIAPDWNNPGAYRWNPINDFDYNLATQLVLGGALGYKVNHYFATDISYNYRTPFNGTIANIDITLPPNPPTFYDDGSQIKSMRSQNLLLNFRITPLTAWGNVSPFAFAGLGIAFNQLAKIRNWDLNPARNSYNIYTKGKTIVSFSWQAGAGINYAITKYLGTALFYRYVDLGNFKSDKKFNALNATLTKPPYANPFVAKNVGVNEVLASITYTVV